jgi:hypothetical protein
VDEFNRLSPEDIDALFQRVRTSQGTDRDHEQFTAAMIQRFCDRVYAGESVDPWIMTAVANQFFKILMGGEWNDEFPLPGRTGTLIRKPSEQRGLEIFCWIENSRRTDSTLNVTDLIHAAANQWNVSYETARAGYYAWKKQLEPVVSNSTEQT